MLRAKNRKAPEPQVGIQHCDAGDGLIKRPYQLWALAGTDDVFGKLADIEIVGNQIVDLVHLASLKLVTQL